MVKNFNESVYRNRQNKYKVIIDTDPGVDDAACLIYAFFEENIKIELITSVAGNTDVTKTTRNVLHLLELFKKDIPVARGAEKAMRRNSINAEYVHQKEGLGGYVPPKCVDGKLLRESAAEAMYRVINDGDGDVIPIMLGPQTNLGILLSEHPEIAKKIPEIVFMGGSPFGHPDYPDYISFNLSSDPDAFKIVLDSEIPLLMIPSDVGRRKAHLDENFVNELKQTNDTGKLLYRMYSKYWEPGYPDKRIATNDSLALFALLYPELFKTEKVSVTVDTEKDVGKTFVEFNGTGNVEMVTAVDREAFLRLLTEKLKKMNDVKINALK